MKLNNPSDLVSKCEQLTAELKAGQKEIEKLNSKLAAGKVDELIASAKAVGKVKFITAKFEGAGSDTLRGIADKIRDMEPEIVAVFADVKGDSVTFAVTSGKDAVAAGVASGKVVAAVAAIAGGKGGGRPDFAMAGAKSAADTDEALDAAEGIILDLRR